MSVLLEIVRIDQKTTEIVLRLCWSFVSLLCCLLLSWRKGLLQFTIHKEVAHFSTRRPWDTVHPSLHSALLLENEHVTTLDDAFNGQGPALLLNPLAFYEPPGSPWSSFSGQSPAPFPASSINPRRALEGNESVLGDNHPDALASANNLAYVIYRRVRYKEAEEICQPVLEAREKVLGVEHPDTLTSVHNLALALRGHGRYKRAEEMARRALEGRKKILGKGHPDTLESVHDLACVLQERGLNEMAEGMYRRAMEGRKKILGEEGHRDTLASADGLASVLQRQGKYI
ncbi:MAG: hypothetical protein M1840_001028 [Geoglossum simile]|nr:MAG: hypothetical protein M1840_001028 [Geoglossum simile]